MTMFESFDFSVVYDKMIDLYRQRTFEPTSMYDVSPEYRIHWSEIYECMQQHGYKKTKIEARIEWYEAVGRRFDRECAKMQKEMMKKNESSSGL